MVTTNEYCPIKTEIEGRVQVDDEWLHPCPMYCAGTQETIIEAPLFGKLGGPVIPKVAAECIGVREPVVQYVETARLYANVIKELRRSGSL